MGVESLEMGNQIEASAEKSGSNVLESIRARVGRYANREFLKKWGEFAFPLGIAAGGIFFGAARYGAEGETARSVQETASAFMVGNVAAWVLMAHMREGKEPEGNDE